MLKSIIDVVDGQNGGAEPGGTNIQEFIMHNVSDHVIYPIHIFNVDLSITKDVLMIWIVAAFLILFLPLIVRSKSLVPKGPVNFIEWIVFFIQDTIIKPNLGEDGYRYAPYLLTAFFFILSSNLLGLVPGGAVATGNISVTASLALLTFFIVQFSNVRKNGIKGYAKSFMPSGVPKIMMPLIFITEVLGMVAKHLALAIRLFANMFGGHLVIFTMIGLIFLFHNIFISPLPIVGDIFVSLLEVLIALIQAYIFTILSAVFIGLGLSSDH
ncbi:MAG: F0F1 ATP synthase subunit A [Calditrichaeota bacterium]|nr:F0F1 ATP synthase subunit A [Calditrichota bacterium]